MGEKQIRGGREWECARTHTNTQHEGGLGEREKLPQSFGQLILRLIELMKDANETLLTNTPDTV